MHKFYHKLSHRIWILVIAFMMSGFSSQVLGQANLLAVTQPTGTPTNATSVVYQYQFDGPLTGFTTSNFGIESGTTVTGAAISSVVVDANPNFWNVTVSTGTGDGDLFIELLNDSGTEGVTSPGLPSTSLAYVIDKTDPSVSIPDLDASSDSGTSNTDNLTNDDTPLFTGTAEAGLTVRIDSDIDGTGVGSGTATGGNYSITTSALSEGTHSITAVVTDAAGNTTTTSGLTVEIDVTDPTVSIPDLDASSDSGTSNTDNLTNDDTPLFTGTAEAGLTVRIDSDIDGTGVGSGTATGGNYSITTSALSETTHSITAVVTDAAGNTTTTTGLTMEVDVSAPLLPPSIPDLDATSDSGSSNTDNLTNDDTPLFTGTAEAGSTVRIDSDIDGTGVGSGIATGGNYSITVSALTETTHSISAIATDAAGNSTSSSLGLTMEVDVTDPTVSIPDLDASSDSGTSNTDNLTNDDTPLFTGTAEAGLTVRIDSDIDGTGVGSGTATGGNYSITTSALSETTHSITAVVTDAAGNTTTTTGLTMEVDVSAPLLPPSIPDLDASSDSGTSNTDNLTNDDTPLFTGTAEAGSTVRIDSDIDGTGVGSGIATGGNYSITVSALTETTHSISAIATDAAGNSTSSSLGLTMEVDITDPTVSIPDLDASSDSGTSNTDNLTNDDTPLFTGTAEAGLTVRIDSDIDGTGVGSGTATGGNYSITTSALSEGTHSITAVVTDAAGNTTTTSGLTVEIDVTDPTVSIPDLDASSDSGTSNTDNLTNDDTPLFTGTAEAGLIVRIDSDIDGTGVGSGTATGGNYSITSSALSETTHSITAVVTDAAGNTTTTTGLTVEVDITDPTVSIPDLDATSDSGTSNTDNLTNDDTPLFTGTAEAGLTVRIDSDIDGTGIGSGTATGGNYSITSSALSETTHSITAVVTDAAGNTTTTTGLTMEVDVTDPTVSIPDLDASSDSGTSNTDNLTNDDTPLFTGTAEAGLTVRIDSDIDGTGVGSGTATGGNYSITSSALSETTHSITAVVTDAAGNTTTTTGLTMEVDVSAPLLPPSIPDLDASSDSGTSNTDNLTNDDTPLFTGTAEAGSTVRIDSDIDGTGVGSGIATGGNYSITVSALTETTHSISAIATDAAGNSTSSSLGLTMEVDLTGPAIPTGLDLDASSDSGISNSDNITNDDTPLINGSKVANTSLELFSDQDGSIGSIPLDASTSFSFSTNVLSDNVHLITAVATDLAGNTSSPSGGLTINVDKTPPTVSSLDPADEEGAHPVGDPFLINFSEDVIANDLGGGEIDLVDNTEVPPVAESIDITSGSVVFQSNTLATDQVSITSPSPLVGNNDYYIVLQANAIIDAAGNAFAGFLTVDDWNFTTGADVLNPTLIVTRESVTTGNPDTGTGDATVTFNLAFDEEINDATFSLNDILLSGSNITIGGSAVPANAGDLSIAANVNLINSGDNQNYMLIFTGIAQNTVAPPAAAPDGNLDITVSNANIEDLSMLKMVSPVGPVGFVFDQDPPEITTLSLTAPPTNTDYAADGQTVTVDMVFNDDLESAPSVQLRSGGAFVNGTVNVSQNGDDATWRAQYTVQSLDLDGGLQYIIDFTDDSENAASATLVGTTGYTAGVVNTNTLTVDKSAAAITDISLSSNNTTDTQHATDGDVVTLSFTINDDLVTPPAVVIRSGGNLVNDVVSVNTALAPMYTATYTVDGINDTDGALTFTIDFTDAADNIGAQASATTDLSSMEIDNDEPIVTASSVFITSDNDTDNKHARLGDVVTLNFTVDDDLSTEPSVTFTSGGMGVAAATIDDSNAPMYTASYTVGGGDTDGNVGFTLSFVDDAGLTVAAPITAVNDGGGTVEVDKTNLTLLLSN